MALSFGPVSAPEWTNLFVMISTSGIVILCFFLSGFSVPWRLWMKEKKFIRPTWFVGPILFTILFSFFMFVNGIAIFLVWREGFRSEAIFSPPGPFSPSSPPNEEVYFTTLLLYIIFLFFQGGFGPIFFGFKSFGWSLVFIIIATIILITDFILSCLIWWVPAILIGISTLWNIYMIVLIASIKLYSPIDPHGNYFPDPLEVMWTKSHTQTNGETRSKKDDFDNPRKKKSDISTSASKRYITTQRSSNMRPNQTIDTTKQMQNHASNESQSQQKNVDIIPMNFETIDI